MAVPLNFIMNTDFDSLKIVDSIVWEINIPSVTLSPGETRTFDYTHTVDDGVYFELQSMKLGSMSNTAFVGGAYFAHLGFSGTHIPRKEFVIKRTDPNTYTMSVALTWGSSQTGTVTIPSDVLTVKLNLLVPSEQ